MANVGVMYPAANIQGIVLRNGGFPVGGDQIYAPNPQNTFWYAGQQMPGICALQPGGVAELLIDEKKGKNVNGSHISVLGYKPGDFDFVILIWTQRQIEKYAELVSQLWGAPTKKTQLAQRAAEVRHPWLNIHNVYQAALKGVYYNGPGPFPQSDTFRWRFKESVLPVSTKAHTVKGAALGLTKNLPQLDAPNNAPPPPPSSNRVVFGPDGQPSSGGSH